MMKGIVDRFEGKYAIVELDGKEMVNIDKRVLPEGIKEGDCLIIDIKIDVKETENRKENIKSLMGELFEN